MTRAPSRPIASRAALYRGRVLESVPRLLGTFDRERFSPTAGSFDRDHWGWQFRDFPIGMLQAGLVPLALLWAGTWPGNPYAQSARLHGWILGGLEATIARQRRNGAFDSVGPFTQDHGVTLQMAHTLTVALRTLGSAVPSALDSRIRIAVAQACRFAARTDEDYAFISNHRALFALAWLRAGNLLGDDALLQRADAEVARIVEHQSEEGWYEEYGGADPGYQSLGMSYLAEYQRERPSDKVADSLRRAVEFMSYFVHPDGGLGGLYGSRLTSLWFPAGFERLADADSVAAAVAGAVAVGIQDDAVVTPRSTDGHNLAPLLYSYLLAAETVGARSAEAESAPELPRDALRGIRWFPAAGLAVVGAERYYAIVNARKGGVGVVHSRQSGRLAWQDAGYVARQGRSLWSSAIDTPSGSAVRDGDQLALRVPFAAVNREIVTPFRFAMLRIANVTIFRSVRGGALMRRWIVRRLITRRVEGPIVLERSFHFSPHSVRIADTLHGGRPGVVDLLARVRSFAPFHMGSSRYFHPGELNEMPDAELVLDAARFNQARTATVRTVVAVDDAGAVSISAEAPMLR